MEPEEISVVEIASLLPAIMQRLFGARPVPAHVRDLTLVQVRALGTIGAHKGCTMGELAKGLHVTLGAATGLVDRLIAQDLVQREADPKDRRVVRLRVTERGRRAHLARIRQVRQRLTQALEGLSPEQRRQVAEALTLLRDALGSAPEEK